MTCKECVHDRVCVIQTFPEAFENTQWEKSPCDHFAKASGWISVDERLPESEKIVIVCDEYGNVGVAYFYKQERKFRWVDNEEIAFATHWMPLPERPKGE